ncbi:MAG: DUF456 domain-containing protein [Bacteroidaceae bacterium]|nr:DUF456 domain-containing protein [Bacteroidaceae bacterium]
MSSTLLLTLAIIAGIIGLIGSIVPGIPGPPISWVGMLFAYFQRQAAGSDDPISKRLLFIWLGITVVVTVLDYVIPAKFTKVAGGSKAGSWGAIIGLFAGMFLTPIGMLSGTLLGAFLGELLVAKKKPGPAVKSALGAFAGFIVGTGLKLLTSGIMMYYIIF